MHHTHKSNGYYQNTTVSKKVISIPVKWKFTLGGNAKEISNIIGGITPIKVTTNESVTYTGIKSGAYFISFNQVSP